MGTDLASFVSILQHTLFETAFKKGRLVFMKVTEHPEIWAVLPGDVQL